MISGCELLVPAGTKELYEKAVVWKDFQIIEQIATSQIDSKEKSPINIYTVNNTIFIENVKSENITIYNARGQLITSIRNTNRIMQINVPQAGVYLVWIDEKVWKIAVTN